MKMEGPRKKTGKRERLKMKGRTMKKSLKKNKGIRIA